MFAQSVIEQLGNYVYMLRDPRNREVFYIGKGIGNRVFNHLACAITEEDDDCEKFERIRAIDKAGFKVEHFIVRHGMSEATAFEVEAALIDLIGIEHLTNIQSGHYATDYGIKTTEEVEALYSAPALHTNLPMMLININKLYNRQMTAAEIYEATRQAWVVGKNRDKAKYAVATYRGLTREVYQIHEWYPIGKRWGFNGVLADEAIRNELRYKSIVAFIVKGASNPIRYLNCK